MSYVIGVVLFWFCSPANLLLVGSFAALVLLLVRRFRLASLLLAASISYVVIASIFGPVLIQNLETAIDKPTPMPQQAYGIVLLGGFINTGLSTQHGQLEVNAAADRLLCFIQLARQYPQAQLVMTGGNAGILGNGSTESQWVEHYLAGSFPEFDYRIQYEKRSRNTAENAANSAKLVDTGQKWLLVTSGFHMPRAQATFHKAGFTQLFPYPCDYKGDNTNWSIYKRLKMWEIWLKEQIGMVWYRVSGRIA